VNVGQTAAFFQELRDFYIENSYGVFRPTFTISTGGAGGQGAFRLNNPFATYGADCGGNVSCNDQEMFDDAIAVSDPSVNFAPFDHIMLYHAGIGQETCTGGSCGNEIWSVYFPGNQSTAEKTFPGFTVVPESEAGSFSPLGVIAHEYGHQLGLPDLYDISFSGGRSTVGAWDVMDYPYTGTLSADGSNPPHFGAWSKKFLGFSSPQSTGGNVSLAPAETTQTGANQVAISAGGSNEYFLMEYRLRTAAGATYDKGIAMSGLLVWHIDDDLALNASALSNNVVNTPSQNGAGHRGVEVVEADGSEPNPQNSDFGSGDAFVDGQTLSAPQSNTFGGQPSGVTIASISGVGGASVSSVVAFIKATTGVNVLKAVNYPNPAGDPSKYPTRAGAPAGTLTTLVLQLTRPVEAGEIELDIYNLNGDRVRSVSGADIALKLGTGEPSTDFKWVYEYDWSGRNDAGDDVVSGVYLYRFKAGSETTTGKLVLIR
jgi:M6 family metalloprotease-like protein